MIDLMIFTDGAWVSLDVSQDELTLEYQYADIKFSEFYCNSSYELTLPHTYTNDTAFLGGSTYQGTLAIDGAAPLGAEVQVSVTEIAESGISVSIQSREKTLFEKLADIQLGHPNGVLGTITTPMVGASASEATDTLPFYSPKITKSGSEQFVEVIDSTQTATGGTYLPHGGERSLGSVPFMKADYLIERIMQSVGYTTYFETGKDANKLRIIPTTRNCYYSMIELLDMPTATSVVGSYSSSTGGIQTNSQSLSSSIMVSTAILWHYDRSQRFHIPDPDTITYHPALGGYAEEFSECLRCYRLLGQYFRIDLQTYYDSNGDYMDVGDIIQGNERDFLQFVFTTQNGVQKVCNYLNTPVPTGETHNNFRLALTKIFAHVKSPDNWAANIDSQGREIRTTSFIICNSKCVYYQDPNRPTQYVLDTSLWDIVETDRNTIGRYFMPTTSGDLPVGLTAQVAVNVPAQAFRSFAVNSYCPYSAIAQGCYFVEGQKFVQENAYSNSKGIGDFTGGLEYDVSSMLAKQTAADFVKKYLQATATFARIKGGCVHIAPVQAYTLQEDEMALIQGEITSVEYEQQTQQLMELRAKDSKSIKYTIGDKIPYEEKVCRNSAKVDGCHYENIEIGFAAVDRTGETLGGYTNVPFVPYSDKDMEENMAVEIVASSMQPVARKAGRLYKHVQSVYKQGKKVYMPIRTLAPQDLPQAKIFIKELNEWAVVEKVSEYDCETLIGTAECYIIREQSSRVINTI